MSIDKYLSYYKSIMQDLGVDIVRPKTLIIYALAKQGAQKDILELDIESERENAGAAVQAIIDGKARYLKYDESKGVICLLQ